MCNELEKNNRTEATDGGVRVDGGRGVIHCLTIIGQVEGHNELPEGTKSTKYEHILPLLCAVEESNEIDGMLILLNTVGGDIEAGMAIAEMIAGMKKPTVSLVLGGGHSIGLPLAVSAQKSIIAPSASITIHPVRISGTVIGAPQTFDYFSQIQQRIVRFVTDHSAITREKLLGYMMASGNLAADVGTCIGGAEAVRSGLINEVGTVSDALAYLHQRIAEIKT